MIDTKYAAVWLDEHRMNRELHCTKDLRLLYGGFADGIASINATHASLDGVENVDIRKTADENGYKGEFVLSLGTLGLTVGQYYSAHVDLTLTMQDGTSKAITDTFVFLYYGEN